MIWRQTKNAAWLLFHILAAAFAVNLLVVSLFPVHAQVQPPTVTDVEIEDLQRRVTAFEAIGIEHRLTTIETLLNAAKQAAEDERSDFRYSMGGTALLICERVYWAVRRKQQEKNQQDP